MKVVISKDAVALPFKAIKEIIDEGVLKFTDGGLSFRAMDPAHVALMRYYAPVEAFHEYSVDKEMAVGVDFDKLAEALSMMKGSQVAIFVDDKQLRLQQFGKVVRLPLLEVDEDTSKVPELEFDAVFKIKPEKFGEIVRDAEKFTETLIIYSDSDIVKFHGYNQMNEEIELSLTDDEVIFHRRPAEGGAVRSMFPLEYLKSFVKAEKSAESLTVRLGQDMPGSFEYALADGVEFSLLLAPRVEAE